MHFIFILDYGNDVRQKANSSNFFLFKGQICHKAEDTACNINNAFDPGTANEHTMLWWFKKCKGDESLQDEKHSGQPPEVDLDQLRGS